MGGTPSYGVLYSIYDNASGLWLKGTPGDPKWTENAQMARRYRSLAHVKSSLGGGSSYRHHFADHIPDSWCIVEMSIEFRHMERLKAKFGPDKR